MPARLPDFIGLGTQKGGTTSLHRWLQDHQQVYLPKKKEIHYFDLNNERSIDWYKEHFQDENAEIRCGEITPYYLFHPNVPDRIKNKLPNIQLIALLRDPVERALSQINHSRKRGFEPLEPHEALAAEKSRLKSGCQYSMQKHSYVSRSRYLEQLDRYEGLFPKKQILILKSEELFTDPVSAWKKITQFLAINPNPLPKIFPKENIGETELRPASNELRLRLRSELMETALGVRERYGFGWDWA